MNCNGAMALPDVTQKYISSKSMGLELSSLQELPSAAAAEALGERAAQTLPFLQLKCGVPAQPQVKHCF